MTNIFQVSHILSAYFTSFQASRITENMRNEENIGQIVLRKRKTATIIDKTFVDFSTF